MITSFFNKNGISFKFFQHYKLVMFWTHDRQKRVILQAKSSSKIQNLSNEKEFLLQGHSEELSDLFNVL